MEVTIVARLNGESRHIKIIKFNFKVRLCGIHRNINTLLYFHENTQKIFINTQEIMVAAVII